MSDLTRDQIIAALQADAACVHAGSPRGVSDVYDYIPVPDAADVVLRLLADA